MTKKLYLSVLVLLFLCICISSRAVTSDLSPTFNPGVLNESDSGGAEQRTIYTAPYTQNFNSSTFPPPDWGRTADYWGDYMWESYQSSWAECKFHQFEFGYWSSFTSPQITIPDYMYRLNFKWSHEPRPNLAADCGYVRIVVDYGGSGGGIIWQRETIDFDSNDGAGLTTPGSGVQESIDLTRFAGMTVHFVFEGLSGYGGYWFIDDFNVSYSDTGINTYPSVQDFSSTTFPPVNWRHPSFANQWHRSGANSYGAAGQGSANAWDNLPTVTITDLESPFLNLGEYGGELSFDHAYAQLAPYAPAHKDLQVLYSINGGNDYNPLATYSGETGGNLVTAPPTTGEFIPSASQWATKSLDIPVGTNRICFRDVNQYGAGYLYIDNVTFQQRNFALGNGTVADPFQISTPKELNNVRLYLGSANAAKCFKLMINIDLLAYLSPGGAGYTMWGTNGWLPIGNNTNYFYGTFDGNGFTISNLRTANYGNYHGLFGISGTGSVIKNLILAGSCYILGDAETGSVVGRNNGTVQNCRSGATVNIGNAESGGGLVGYNVGTISGSSFSGIITRSGTSVSCNKIGGVCGYNHTGALINESFSTGSVTGNGWCGGLVGWNNGTIARCYTTGNVSGAQNTIGGLVGQHNGIITDSYSRATVSGAQYIGGLVGYNSGSTITNCYSTGTVSGSIRGGLCGQSGGTITNSYWDTQTSGIATSYGGTGKTTVQMNTLSTYTGWDFVGETASGSDNYWNIATSINASYPFHTWENSTILFPPLLISPGNGTTGLPRSGFDLTWSQDSQTITPVYYNVIIHSYYAYLRYPGISGTSFNPVTEGGFDFPYPYNPSDNWTWRVEAVAADSTTAMSVQFYFRIENDPSILIQPSTPMLQDFSGAAFPPSTWTLSTGSSNWSRSNVNAWGANGTGSALADFYSINQGEMFDLKTPLFNIFNRNGLLSFDHAYATSANENDQLEILYSIDFGSSFQSLIVYNGGTNGELVTAPPQVASFVPAAGQWASKYIDLPVGTNMLKFRGISNSGNRLYLDNILVETFSFSVGTGTQTNPFQISTDVDLAIVSDNETGISNANRHYKLMNNLDLTVLLGEMAWWGYDGWMPIGSSSTPFYGHFDGNGKGVSGLWQNRPTIDNSGLFGYTGAGATIQNLGVNTDTALAFIGGSNSGILVGHNFGSVTGCFTTGNIQGSVNTIGGLVGRNAGTISSCYSQATVNGANYTGGVCGYNNAGAYITESCYSGSVTGNTWCGGLVGWNDGTIAQCYTTGTVSGAQNTIGGLVGQHQGIITNSHSRANVSGVEYIGGLVGWNDGQTTSCYSTGTVSGSIRGGLSGQNTAAITSSYWDTQTSGIATSYGGTGKTTAQMNDQSTYSGWDFTDTWFIHSAVNSGYPQFLWTGIPLLPFTPTNLLISQGTLSPTLGLNWDDMGASWYGVYAGSSPDNLTYLGYVIGNSLAVEADVSSMFYKITSGTGAPAGTQLNILRNGF